MSPSAASPRIALALLGGAALVVRELGPLALERGEVLVRSRLRALGAPPSPELGRVERASHAAGRRAARAARPGGASLARGSARSARLAGETSMRGALLGGGRPSAISRWSTSSFISPETKRTVPIAWG